MNILSVLDKFQQDLKSWTDGPKFVLVHGIEAMAAIKIAEELGVSVMVSSMGQTAAYLDRVTSKVGTFFMVVSKADEAEAYRLKDDVLHRLDVRIISL